MLTDPQYLATSAKVLQDHRRELAFLADLIKWRLELCDREQNEWTADDEFCWKFALRGWGRHVPPEIEEQAADLYNRHDYDQAAAIFQLLIDCFDGYAEGYNYLGLIALARNDQRAAIAHFEKTIELGRKLFPAKIARKRYWSDHDTRPYMRGLRNLTLALVEGGRFDDALRICDLAITTPASRCHARSTSIAPSNRVGPGSSSARSFAIPASPACSTR
jgi:tetratricopeptide (TPR) repeat protein